jgi:hypothetical protein
MQRMTRTLCAAFVASAALFAVPGAQAKAPPDGLDVCGADDACIHLTMEQAEQNWALWSSANEQSDLPHAVAPFLLVRWHWPGDPAERSAYYVPSTGQVRQHESDLTSWSDLQNAGNVRAMTAKLTPFPVPRVTRVTVGGRAVRDPQSYLDIFGAGKVWFSAILPRWLRITFTADAPSPWTDGADDYFISRKGRLLWIDGNIVRIPLQLAQRIRARRSLAPSALRAPPRSDSRALETSGDGSKKGRARGRCANAQV